MNSFKMISQYNIITKKQVYNMLILLAGIIVNILSNVILVPHYGIIGAAWGSVIGYTFSSIIFVIYFSKCENITTLSILFPNKDDIKFIMIVLSKFYNRIQKYVSINRRKV